MCNIRQSVFRLITLTNTHSIRIPHFSISGTIHQNTIAVSKHPNPSNITYKLHFTLWLLFSGFYPNQ